MMFMKKLKFMILVLMVLALTPSAYAGINELPKQIGEAVFNATKEGARTMILEEVGMTNAQDTANNYQANQDSLMGLFYWGIISNPDPMEGGVVRAIWLAVFSLLLMTYTVYVVIIGFMYMIPKYSNIQMSGEKKARATKRLENMLVGIMIMPVSYLVYAFLVLTNAELIAGLNLDMATFILELISGGHLVAMALSILLFFVLSLLLIYRYFIVWLGPIIFTVGLAMRYMDQDDEPGFIGTTGNKLISYSVGMIFIQFIVAFYMFMMIQFYESMETMGWLFKETMIIGVVLGGIFIFFKILGFMSSGAAQRATKFVITRTPGVYGRGKGR